ncbi:MAG: hypothetical protein GX443_07720 [Deltaproteobacteria bacterium]|nr:hypothetical protein [Deltaproteobacteria bacterium]
MAIEAEIDEAFYPTGIKVPGVNMVSLAISRDELHGERN